MVITYWMSSYSTIDCLAVWEEIHNPDDFNRLEFQSVRNERGRLIMTPKQWIEKMQVERKFHIPVGTLSHWEQGVRTPPDYVVYMLLRIIYMEREQYQNKDFSRR